MKQKYMDMVRHSAVNSSMEQINKFSLQMFYTADMENVYYAKDIDCFIVAEVENDVLLLQSVICRNKVMLSEILQRVGTKYHKCRLGFTPASDDMYMCISERYNGENEYTSLPPFMIQSVKFAVPVDHDGEPWLEKQKEIAAGYVTLEQTKETVVEQIANLSQVSIVPNCDEYAIEYLPLSELFDTIKGKSKYTKKYGNLHSGPYPVYSASSQGTLTHLDTYDYDGRYMTWSTNGFAGTILILDGKFSINGDRGILVPKNGRQDLDFDYMKFTLEPIFRELAKGRKGDNGEDEFTKLYPSMLNDIMVPIPVDGEGNISLSLQKEIAQKFISVQNSQKEIIEKLDALISKKISI